MDKRPDTLQITARKSRSAILVIGILLIAANLRAPITGLAPLLDMIRDATSLGSGAAGGLTTLPLLAFAVASPFCVLLTREYGLERCLFAALVLIAAGVALRGVGSVWTLFAGTATTGAGIAVANVLLPSLLKRDFPDRITALTSGYALTAGVAAAAASVLAVPIASLPGSDWNMALLAFLPVSLVALAFWIPQLSSRSAPTRDTPTPPHGGPIWRSALAWQVTGFFGLNSLVYYSVVAWLPAILIEAGYSPVAAGSIHGMCQFATAIPGLILGPLIGRRDDQRTIAVVTATITGLSLLGFALVPDAALAWATLFGFGTGASFILALAFVSLRAADMRGAAALSGMAQCVGYAIAATAPPLLGIVHDGTHAWRLPLLLCTGACVLLAVFGGKAGRSAFIV